ncbi:MAG: hypothetical protein AAF564_23195, partial [Bacteroidota bacterium]
MAMKFIKLSLLNAFFMTCCLNAQDVSFMKPGDLLNGTGSGVIDSTIYLNNIRFPIESPPAYANSQVYSPGGSKYNTIGSASKGARGECDESNYSYPWRDTFCETRDRRKSAICPTGTKVHLGVDIRPSTCEKDVHYAVAVDSAIV